MVPGQREVEPHGMPCLRVVAHVGQRPMRDVDDQLFVTQPGGEHADPLDGAEDPVLGVVTDLDEVAFEESVFQQYVEPRDEVVHRVLCAECETGAEEADRTDEPHDVDVERSQCENDPDGEEDGVRHPGEQQGGGPNALIPAQSLEFGVDARGSGQAHGPASGLAGPASVGDESQQQPAGGADNAREIRWHAKPTTDDVRFLSDHAYRYDVRELGLEGSQLCYSFEVGNISLASTTGARKRRDVTSARQPSVGWTGSGSGSPE